MLANFLEAAGIPTYLGAYADESDDVRGPSEIRIMIPSLYTLKAESVLDKEINNPAIEDIWRTHLATLSDRDFRNFDFESIISGLTDRLERLRTAYKDECATRAERD